MKTFLLALVLVIPSISEAQITITGTQRLTWDQAAPDLESTKSLVVRTYINPPPQGPVLESGIARTFACFGTTSPFTCQLTVDANTILGNVTGNFIILLAVQNKNSDGTLTPEVFSNSFSFRINKSSAAIPVNLRFAAILP